MRLKPGHLEKRLDVGDTMPSAEQILVVDLTESQVEPEFHSS